VNTKDKHLELPPQDVEIMAQEKQMLVLDEMEESPVKDLMRTKISSGFASFLPKSTS